MKKACSGKWSYSPSLIFLNASMVSLIGTYEPVDAGELLGRVGVLRQEALDPAGPAAR